MISADLNSAESQDGTQSQYSIVDSLLTHLSDFMCKNGRPAKILVIGDSHTQRFVDGQLEGNFEESKDAVCKASNYFHCGVVGASAHGLLKRNSTTAAAAIFDDCLSAQIGSLDAVAIAVGDCDIRFLTSLRSVSYLDQIHLSVKNLFTYIHDELIGKYNLAKAQIVILGVPHSCPGSRLAHDHELQEDPNHYRVTRFNDELRDRSLLEGIAFADPSEDLFDLSTGGVHRYFWSRPSELHCSPKRTYYFWHRAIKNALGFQWCSESAAALG